MFAESHTILKLGKVTFDIQQLYILNVEGKLTLNIKQEIHNRLRKLIINS